MGPGQNGDNFNTMYNINAQNIPLQQGLQPTRDTFTVTIQKCEHFSSWESSTDQSSTYQSLPFIGSNKPYSLKVTDVLLQLGLQIN